MIGEGYQKEFIVDDEYESTVVGGAAPYRPRTNQNVRNTSNIEGLFVRDQGSACNLNIGFRNKAGDIYSSRNYSLFAQKMARYQRQQ